MSPSKFGEYCDKGDTGRGDIFSKSYKPENIKIDHPKHLTHVPASTFRFLLKLTGEKKYGRMAGNLGIESRVFVILGGKMSLTLWNSLDRRFGWDSVGY
jgi:hypothetical protein